MSGWQQGWVQEMAGKLNTGLRIFPSKATSLLTIQLPGEVLWDRLLQSSAFTSWQLPPSRNHRNWHLCVLHGTRLASVPTASSRSLQGSGSRIPVCLGFFLLKVPEGSEWSSLLGCPRETQTSSLKVTLTSLFPPTHLPPASTLGVLSSVRSKFRHKEARCKSQSSGPSIHLCQESTLGALRRGSL